MATTSFGLVERCVRTLLQQLDGDALPRNFRDADTDRDPRRTAARERHAQALDGEPDALRGGARADDVGRRKDEHELLAAEPRVSLIRTARPP